MKSLWMDVCMVQPFARLDGHWGVCGLSGKRERARSCRCWRDPRQAEPDPYGRQRSACSCWMRHHQGSARSARRTRRVRYENPGHGDIMPIANHRLGCPRRALLSYGTEGTSLMSIYLQAQAGSAHRSSQKKTPFNLPSRHDTVRQDPLVVVKRITVHLHCAPAIIVCSLCR